VVMVGGQVLGQGLPRQYLLPLLPLKLVCTRTVKQWLHHNASYPPEVVITDFENAFNCIDRRTSQCCQHCPTVAPSSEWFYSESTLRLPSSLAMSSFSPPLGSSKGPNVE